MNGCDALATGCQSVLLSEDLGCRLHTTVRYSHSVLDSPLEPRTPETLLPNMLLARLGTVKVRKKEGVHRRMRTSQGVGSSIVFFSRGRCELILK